MSAKEESINSIPDEAVDPSLECSICLQTCLHPAQLPCGHIFCFLCIKGVGLRSRRCALCREPIPQQDLIRPKLVNEREDSLKAKEENSQISGGSSASSGEKKTWYYEGRGGWWEYDERTCVEIEKKWVEKAEVFELLVAGYLYMIDLKNMLQYRHHDNSRKRRIKRDRVDIPDRKGVAGLRIDTSRDGTTEDTSSRSSNSVTSRPSQPAQGARNTPQPAPRRRPTRPGAAAADSSQRRTTRPRSAIRTHVPAVASQTTSPTSSHSTSVPPQAATPQQTSLPPVAARPNSAQRPGAYGASALDHQYALPARSGVSSNNTQLSQSPSSTRQSAVGCELSDSQAAHLNRAHRQDNNIIPADGSQGLVVTARDQASGSRTDSSGSVPSVAGPMTRARRRAANRRDSH